MISDRAVLTDSAERKLKDLQDEYRRRLVDLALQQKFIPGEAEYELTASDLERAATQVRIVRRQRYTLTRFLLYIYAILGVVGALAGFYYPQLKKLYTEDQTRFSITASSILLALISGVMTRYLTLREKRFDRNLYERDYATELRLLSPSIESPRLSSYTHDADDTHPSVRIERDL